MKKQIIKNFVLIILLYSSLVGQLQMKMTTNKAVYEYGEKIKIYCLVSNVTDTTFKILSASHESCDAQFRLNDYYSGEWTDCLLTFKEIYYKPHTTKIFKWTIDPKIFGLPNKDGVQQIVGEYSYGVGDFQDHTYYEIKDTVYIQAPEYLGGQISVRFSQANDSVVALLKDSLQVEVLDRELYDNRYYEKWDVTGYNVDSLYNFLSGNAKIEGVEFERFIQYDSVYVTSPKDFYPLSVGNKWLYESYGHVSEFIDSAHFVYIWSAPLSVEVVDESIVDNNKVFELLVTYKDLYSDEYENYTLYESITNEGEVYSSQDLSSIFNEDEIRFNLSSQVGDSVQLKLFDYSWFFNKSLKYYHEKDTVVNVLGNSALSFVFSKETEHFFYQTKFAEDFGLIEQYGVDKGSNHWETSLSLKGCIIDGIAYGDTSLIVSVEDEEESLPNKFSLSQNYPNPFNPTTKIKFSIPQDVKRQTSNVKLIIYDALGREIKTLLNKPIQPGQYEVEFNGGNLSSGIYFYKLSNGSFVQTKKMVLIK